MRVPTPIAISSCLVATVTMWYFSTRSADFTTPPDPEQQSQAAKQWQQENLPPTAATALSSELKNKKATKPTVALVKPAPKPKPTPLPHGDLGQAPRLSEYGNLGNHGAAAMIQLAEELENKNAPKRAMLAWERVLDTTSPNEQEVAQAGAAIQRLGSTLPPWNPDPNADLTITLHAGATVTNKQALKDALTNTAQTIAEASGYTLEIKTQTSLGTGKQLETPRIPVAIWFSRAAHKSGTPSSETPPLSFMANPTDTMTLTSQCKTAVYSLLSTHLADTTAYSKLPEPPHGEKPDKILRNYITRLMWREFANSLK